MKCSLCGERLVARPRSGGLRRYACAKGPGFSGCGGTYINAEPLEPFIVEAVLWRIDSPELTAALNGRQDEPDAERWQAEADAAQRPARGARRPPTGSSRSRWVSCSPPANRSRHRLTAARKQLGKLTRTTALDGYLGNRDALRETWETLDLSRQRAIIAAVIDHIEVGPGRRGYNRFDESRLTPAWRA